MRRFFIFVLIMIALLTFSEQVLRYGELNKPLHWWPYFDDYPITLRTMDLYLDTLVEDYSHAQRIKSSAPVIKPQMIEENIKVDFEKNPQMRLLLNENYRWSNGSHVTSNDVAFTINEILRDKENITVFNYLAETIREVRTKGREIDINFYFPSKYMLSSLEIYIIPSAFKSKYNYRRFKNASLKSIKDWCSGPFIPSKESMNSVEFVSNPNYPYSVNITKVVMYIVRDVKTLTERFLNKDLDMIFEVPSSEYADKIRAMKGMVNEAPSLENRFMYVALNYAKRPIFRDEDFRRLLIQSINRRDILQSVFLGRGQLITGPFLPTFQWIDSSITPWEYSESKAKELARRYGSKLSGQNWIFIYPKGREELAKVAFAIKEQLTKGSGIKGFKITLKKLSIDDYQEALKKGDFDIALVEYAAMRSFVSLKPLLSENGSQNYGRFNSMSTLSYDQELTKLLEKVEGPQSFRLDDIERASIYKKIHRLAHEREYHLWLFSIEREAFFYKYVNIPYIDPSRPFKNIEDWYIERK